MRRLGVALAGIALACLTACADEAEAPAPADDTGGDPGRVEAVALGAGLVAAVPAGTPVEPLTDTAGAAAGEAECHYLQGVVGEGDDRIELSLNAAACAGEPEDRIGNGFHGRYVEVDDVAEAGDVSATTVPAGDLTTFTQPYYECTNECNDYDDSVALLALAAPPDPAHPVLMLLSPKGEAPPSALESFASTIRVG